MKDTGRTVRIGLGAQNAMIGGDWRRPFTFTLHVNANSTPARRDCLESAVWLSVAAWPTTHDQDGACTCAPSRVARPRVDVAVPRSRRPHASRGGQGASAWGPAEHVDAGAGASTLGQARCAARRRHSRRQLHRLLWSVATTCSPPPRSRALLRVLARPGHRRRGSWLSRQHAG